MRRVEILLTCDACAAWESKPEVTAGVEEVPVGSGMTLDLCERHREGTRRVFELVAEWGQAPERTNGRKLGAAALARASSAPVAPAHTSNGASKRGGKRARQRRANAQQAAAAADTSALAPTCPLCGLSAATVDSLGHHTRSQHGTTLTELYGDTCPVCARQGTARALGVHASKAHGVTGVPLLFALAQQQGDPHGVLAQRAAAMAAQ